MEWCFDLEKQGPWEIFGQYIVPGHWPGVKPLCSVGILLFGDFGRISVGKEILLQIFLSNGSGVCTSDL